MKAITVVGFIFCLVAELFAQSRSDNLLDLTRKKAPPKREAGPFFGGSVGVPVFGGKPVPRTIEPVKLTLLSLDKPGYTFGDEIIFEVELENITNDVLILPWSDDYEKASSLWKLHPGSRRDALLSLVYEDGLGATQFACGVGIYGSESAPETVKMLSPKKTVRIRASGPMGYSDENTIQRLILKLPKKFDLRADFTIFEELVGLRYKPVVSGNFVTVEVRKRID